MPSRADNREKTAEKVLEAAERLFAERTFKGSTVRDIAQAAGVSVGTVMGVGDKSGLLVRVFERQIRRVHEQRRDHVWDREDIDKELGDRIIALVRPFVDTFTTSPELSREYGAILMSGTHSSAIFQELAQELIREIGRVLESAGFTEQYAQSASRAIYLSYLGLLFVWGESGSDEDVAFFEGIRSIIQFVVYSREG